jgi:hypothetical protein
VGTEEVDDKDGEVMVDKIHEFVMIKLLNTYIMELLFPPEYALPTSKMEVRRG